MTDQTRTQPYAGFFRALTKTEPRRPGETSPEFITRLLKTVRKEEAKDEPQRPFRVRMAEDVWERINAEMKKTLDVVDDGTGMQVAQIEGVQVQCDRSVPPGHLEADYEHRVEPIRFAIKYRDETEDEA